MLALLLLAACAPAPECPPCPEDAPGSVSLAPWESALLGPALEDLRAGIRVVGDQGFGICSGRSECESFVGPSPLGPLPDGSWFVRAEVRVPEIGDGWSMAFHLECTTNPGAPNAATQVHDRQYPVRWMGEERAYRLQPLWKIQAPHPSGPRSCTYSLTPIRPDGVRGEPLTGAYETAGPEPSGATPGGA